MKANLLGPIDDATLAVMALAGIRELKQSTASPTTGANATYTVTDGATRRVVVTHMGCASPAAGDIRFLAGAVAATAASMPLYPQRYMVFEANAGDVLNFFNTGADTVVVYVSEIT